MGKELKTVVRVGDQRASATVLLESEEVIVSNSELRARVKLSAPTRKAASISGAWLTVGNVSIELGADAKKWLEAIQNPKSIAQKLGLKAGQPVVVRASVPDDVRQLIDASGASVVAKPSDEAWVFVGVASSKDVAKLPAAPARGALWVLRPKGKDSPVAESETRSAARALGLVDIKVVGVSATHSAEKYVWPKKS